MSDFFKKNRKRNFTIVFAIRSILLAIIVLLVFLLNQNENWLHEDLDKKNNLYLLADELRQSSDDLSRFVRAYAATGDPKFEKYYQEVLDIRNGKIARPVDYYRIYWDFVANDGNSPRPDEKKISLRELMAEAGFTNEEFDKLDSGREKSDELVEVEIRAMNAIKGIFPDEDGNYDVRGEPDLALANDLVNNARYYELKAGIMASIDEFYEMFQKRTDESANNHIANVSLLSKALLATVILFFTSFLLSFMVFKRQIGQEDKTGIAMENVGGEMERIIMKKTRELNRKLQELSVKNDLLKNSEKAVMNVLEDVETEKKKTQVLAEDLEKFKLAVDNASDNIVITDGEGKVLYGNRTVKKITGFSIDEIIGRKAGTKENWGGNMSMDFYKNFWKTVKKEKKIFRGKVQNTRKNGEKYLADLSVSPILNEKGEVEFFVAIERDITKEFEVDRAKTEFVSLASHQLKTPLTAIKWNTEILLDSISKDKSKKAKEAKETIDEIYKSNERMIDLVNALLNVSRIDLGTFAVDPKDVDPKDLAENILRELDSVIKSKNLKLLASYDKKIGKIFADPKLLTIVIQNLLTNAIKYTPEKGEIEVLMKKDGNFMEFSVKDSGIGIPKQQQSKIFNKLFRAENAVQKVSDGTGLGLYVAKAVVEQSGGKIWFKSKEGDGTTFSFTIPLSGMKKKEGNRELVPID